jgi:hypothetical protein
MSMAFRTESLAELIALTATTKQISGESLTIKVAMMKSTQQMGFPRRIGGACRGRKLGHGQDGEGGDAKCESTLEQCLSVWPVNPSNVLEENVAHQVSIQIQKVCRGRLAFEKQQS